MTVDGVFRGSTFRTRIAPPTLKTAPGPVRFGVPTSPGIPVAVKSTLKTPWDDTTLCVSEIRAEVRSSGLSSLWSGKSVGFNW